MCSDIRFKMGLIRVGNPHTKQTPNSLDARKLPRSGSFFGGIR